MPNAPGTAGGLIQSPSAVRTSRPGSFDCARNVMKLLSVCGAKPNSLSSGDGCGGEGVRRIVQVGSAEDRGEKEAGRAGGRANHGPRPRVIGSLPPGYP